MTLPAIEKRTLSASVRALPGNTWEIGGTAVGYGIHSQDLGGFRERIQRGAFSRSLASKQDVKCLFNHDQNFVLGRSSNGTLTLSDGPDALRFLCRLNPDSQMHRDLHASVKRGDISEMSFAFALDGDKADVFDDAPESELLVNDESLGDASNDEVKPAKNDEAGSRARRSGKTFRRRTVRSAKLFDVSPVTTPAYSVGTSVAARSASYVLSRRAAAAPANMSLAQHDAEMRAKLNRQAIEINMAAPGLRIPFGTTRVVPMTHEECGNVEGWGKDAIFLTDTDINARFRALVLGARIKHDQAREELRQFLADINVD